MDFDGLIKNLVILFIVMVLVLVAIGVFFFPIEAETPTIQIQQDSNSISKEWFQERFDQMENGLINSSIDLCFRNGGSYLLDGNGQLQTMEFQNTLIIPCILQ